MPSPRPGPGQILLDVKTASLNFPDVLMAQGRYQVKPPLQREAVCRLVRRGGGPPRHQRAGALEGAADAMRRMANRQLKGKVVILPEA